MNDALTGPPAAAWTTQEAIIRAQQGDSAAFEHLDKAHSKHVYSVCLRMLKNTAEAEDLTQQVFLHVFRKIGTFRGESVFSTWLHRVTLNIVLMHLRRNRTAVALGDSFDDNTTDGNYVGEFAPPDTSAAGVIDRLNLARAIQELPAAYKRFFYLHDVIGYEQAEIARLLGCSTGSSKSHLRRAHKCLHRLLQGERSSPHRHLAFRHVSFNGAVRPRRVTTGDAVLTHAHATAKRNLWAAF